MLLNDKHRLWRRDFTFLYRKQHCRKTQMRMSEHWQLMTLFGSNKIRVHSAFYCSQCIGSVCVKSICDTNRCLQEFTLEFLDVITVYQLPCYLKIFHTSNILLLNVFLTEWLSQICMVLKHASFKTSGTRFNDIGGVPILQVPTMVHLIITT